MTPCTVLLVDGDASCPGVRARDAEMNGLTVLDAADATAALALVASARWSSSLASW